MRRIALTAFAVLTLVFVPAAGAKEITAAKVCGPEGCAAVEDEAGRLVMMTAGSPTEPPARAPFYRVSGEYAAEGHRETVSFDAVPARKAIRYDDGNWHAMTAEQVALIDSLVADRKAFPADGLMGAAEPPAPQPAPASDGDSPLWPAALIVGLVALLVTAAARRAMRASSRPAAAGR